MPDNNRYQFFIHYPERHCTYIMINKVATRSLLVACEKAFGKGEPLLDNPIKIFDFKFAFVRNPYDRTVSCWLNQIAQPTAFSKILFQNGMHRAFWRYPGLKPGMTFPGFVKTVVDIPDETANPHFKSQSFFITDEGGQLIPDFIGRFEMLQEDFNIVCQRVGAERVQLPHRNRTAKREPWKKYYTKETKRLIYERYKRDFENFGYQI